ncbi:MAG: exodeoxyribonuclease V subunit beta [Zoogloeaceae bacterium]|jgi:exodeoxyribonuclease V beta subunit|nr:exodeoxyribonuclease V subunit beta [Zoogloeaceae bacterium]
MTQPLRDLDLLNCPLFGVSLIEAAAGTGKTWAICALAARLVAERDIEIGKLLIVTFTNAATAELRERVRQRLQSLVQEDSADPFRHDFFSALERRGIPPETARMRLKAALTAFDEAAIFTIHSFCQRALGEYPFAATQPFAQELGNTDALIRQASLDYWRRFIAQGTLSGQDALALGLTPETLENLLHKRLAQPLAATCWPEDLPPFPPPAADANANQALAAAFRRAQSLWQAERDAILQTLAKHQAGFNKRSFPADALESGAVAWDALFQQDDPAADWHSKEAEKAARRFAAETLRRVTNKGKTTPEHPFFAAAETLLAEHATRRARLDALRLALFRHFLEWAFSYVAAEQQRLRLLSFDSLLTRLHQALHAPGGAVLAARLRECYPAALIDEFQDTDPIQFGIFARLHGLTDGTTKTPEENPETALFWVGDPKQAIYRFRQADLMTYFQARRLVAPERIYALNANQRSTPGVIAGVNTLFARNPAAFMLADLSFTPASRGQKPLPELVDSSVPRRASFHFMALPEIEKEDDEDKDTLAVQATAMEIAHLLAAARRGETRLGDQPLRSGRIAVLVRTHRQGEQIKIALRQRGIQASERSRAEIFQSAEAEDLECLLLALEQARPAAFLAALATPLLGFSAAGIARLTADETELNRWCERFQTWRQRWRTHGLAAALAELGEETRLAARLLALPDWERRLTNVLHLIELLRGLEAQTPQPRRLLQVFAQARQQADHNDETRQLRLESDRDLIAIVTIHQSKGLEYDIVFCPFLWRDSMSGWKRPSSPLSLRDAQGKTVLDFRPDAPDDELRAEETGEMLRLHYVALTRAVHRCYLVYDPGNPASLLNWLAAGKAHDPAPWRYPVKVNREQMPDPATVRANWAEIIRATNSSVTHITPEAQTTLSPPAAKIRQDFQALVARRTLKPDWRIGSFSSLIAARREYQEWPETAASDHDALSSSAPAAAPAETPETDILHFPCGPRAGDALHSLLEHTDFAHPEAEDLRLRDFLRNLMATPLTLPGAATPLYLKDLPPEKRRMELEFFLSVPELAAPRLIDLMAAQNEPLPSLDFPPLRGFLKGFIDMTFTHEGRYYVLDWKSNHLGWRAEDYNQTAMTAAMREHGYYLQARLYLLALHRYLGFRLTGYVPEQHLGGACYLFLRGVRPHWQDPEGRQCGVFVLEPNLALLREMEDLMV